MLPTLARAGHTLTGRTVANFEGVYLDNAATTEPFFVMNLSFSTVVATGLPSQPQKVAESLWKTITVINIIIITL